VTIDINITVFENNRAKLMGIAYRFLSTISDAEDVVQDVYLKWSNADKTTINNAEAWLKKVCTRNCLDILKSVEKKRINYIGTWLPEPIENQQKTPNDESYDDKLAESLTTAFLLVLERLTAKERAAYLLYEIFDTPYTEIANTLKVTEAACRKLVSRAKNNISNQRRKNKLPYQHAANLLNAFQHAVIAEDITQLQSLLTNDVIIKADGGGKVPALLQDIIGNKAVIPFLANELSQFWFAFNWQASLINGNPGFIIKDNNSIHAIVSFEFSNNGSNKITAIFIVRNPSKIKKLQNTPIH
jgi:RNA polymerase sigma-70 factor (ECF subfamily)